ncbi:hypothetical protein HY464_03215 [Candidatus Peregrinibacteria bacterium]|nr:hypothetical protein [Candidatus Peregrinibacteria bacterium]MBI4129675.1 hypothetical protein [Candidatus Peregrinibacteria bacterium]
MLTYLKCLGEGMFFVFLAVLLWLAEAVCLALLFVATQLIFDLFGIHIHLLTKDIMVSVIWIVWALTAIPLLGAIVREWDRSVDPEEIRHYMDSLLKKEEEPESLQSKDTMP